MPNAQPTIAIRPIAASDAEPVLTLLDVALAGTPHLAPAQEAIALASGGDDREYRALVALREGQIRAVACYGDLLGSEKVIELHLMALASPEEQDVARELLAAVDDASRASGARFVFAELPDDGTLDATYAALHDAGYREETRIADYVRDGVALVFLRRTL